ncbi:unnamed protein product [Amoebophrya sp. A25]|nr:unnamed protein product [Amoebophrya sp. A25]|eukprot:GSA25T00013695001.1
MPAQAGRSAATAERAAAAVAEQKERAATETREKLTEIKVIPKKKDASGFLRATPWDPWDLRDFDATLAIVFPQEYKEKDVLDNRQPEFPSLEEEFDYYRLMSHKTLLQLREHMSRVSEHDFHNLLGRRFQFELDQQMSECFDKCSKSLVGLMLDLVYRYLEGRMSRDGMKKECEAKIAANEAKMAEAMADFETRRKQLEEIEIKQRKGFLKETMALREALKKTNTSADIKDQQVPMYYESQDQLSPDIKELVNALVLEQLQLQEGANESEKQKLRDQMKGMATGGQGSDMDVQELLKQLQKAKEQRDRAQLQAETFKDQLSSMQAQRAQEQSAGDKERRLSGSSPENLNMGIRGRGSREATAAEAEAIARSASLEDELAALQRKLDEVSLENAVFKKQAKASAGGGGPSPAETAAMQMELEKLRMMVARHEDEKKEIQRKASAELKKMKDALGDLTPEELEALKSASSAEEAALNEKKRKLDAQSAALAGSEGSMSAELEEKDRLLKGKTEEVQQLQVALEELRLRVVNLNDLLKNAGADTAALREAGLDDVIQGQRLGGQQNSAYGKYKFWKTWDRLYQDARDRIVRLEQIQREAWGEREKVFLQIYYSIMGEDYTREKAEMLRGDPYPSSPHVSPRTSPHRAMGKHKAFSSMLYSRISPDHARADYEEWKERADGKSKSRNQKSRSPESQMMATGMSQATHLEQDISAQGPGGVARGLAGATPIKSKIRADPRKDSKGRWLGPPPDASDSPNKSYLSPNKSFLLESAKKGAPGLVGVMDYSQRGHVVNINRHEQSYAVTSSLSPRGALRKYSFDGSASASPMKSTTSAVANRSPAARMNSPKLFQLNIRLPGEGPQGPGAGPESRSASAGASSSVYNRSSPPASAPMGVLRGGFRTPGGPSSPTGRARGSRGEIGVISENLDISAQVEHLEQIRSGSGGSRSPTATKWTKAPPHHAKGVVPRGHVGMMSPRSPAARRDDTALEQAAFAQKTSTPLVRSPKANRASSRRGEAQQGGSPPPASLVLEMEKTPPRDQPKPPKKNDDPLGLREQAVERAMREYTYNEVAAAMRKNEQGPSAGGHPDAYSEAMQLAAAQHMARLAVATSLADGMNLNSPHPSTKPTDPLPMSTQEEMRIKQDFHFPQTKPSMDRPPGRRVRTKSSSNSAVERVSPTRNNEFALPGPAADPNAERKKGIITLNNPFDLPPGSKSAAKHEKTGGASSSSYHPAHGNKDHQSGPVPRTHYKHNAPGGSHNAGTEHISQHHVSVEDAEAYQQQQLDRVMVLKRDQLGGGNSQSSPQEQQSSPPSLRTHEGAPDRYRPSRGLPAAPPDAVQQQQQAKWIKMEDRVNPDVGGGQSPMRSPRRTSFMPLRSQAEPAPEITIRLDNRSPQPKRAAKQPLQGDMQQVPPWNQQPDDDKKT